MISRYDKLDIYIATVDTTLGDKVCQWLETDQWFPPPIKLTVTI